MTLEEAEKAWKEALKAYQTARRALSVAESAHMNARIAAKGREGPASGNDDCGQQIS